MKLTPREFFILLSAEKEKRYDDLELRARESLMNRISQGKEKLKFEDLFRRPEDSIVTVARGDAFEEEIEETLDAQEFISKLKFE